MMSFEKYEKFFHYNSTFPVLYFEQKRKISYISAINYSLVIYSMF